MLNFLKPKSEKQKLQAQYEKLLKESYRLSTINRAQSDLKAAEADALARKIDSLD